MSLLARLRTAVSLAGVAPEDRHLVAYMTTAHALCHGVMLSIPILLPIWITEFGTSTTVLGLVVTAQAGLFGLLALPSGLLADRVGAHRLVVAFLLVTGTAFLLVPAVDSLSMLAVVVALAGAGAGLYHAPGLSLVSRRATQQSTAFAYHGLGSNLGIGLGPLLVTVGLAFTDWRTVLLLAAVPLVGFGVLFGLRGPDDPVVASDSGHDADAARNAGGLTELRARLDGLYSPLFLVIVVMYVFVGLYYRGSLTFLPDFLQQVSGLPPVTIGDVEVEGSRLAYSAILLVGAVGQLIGGALGDRYGPEPVLAGAYVVTAVALAVIGLGSGIPAVVLVAGGVFGLVLFALVPVQSALVSDYTPVADRGLGFGLVFAVNFGLGALGAGFAGWMVDTSGYGRLFLALAALPLGALAAVGALRYFASRDRTVRPAPSD